MPSALPPIAVLRFGGTADATTISALAIQVFLDTYAREGVRPDLAREAFTEYSASVFERRLVNPKCLFIVAERGSGLLGFAELSREPLRRGSITREGIELVRLYVQPAHQRAGLGSLLLQEAESQCRAFRANTLWLTAWSENRRALDFYCARGYKDMGSVEYVFEDQSYENRLLIKHPLNEPAA